MKISLLPCDLPLLELAVQNPTALEEQLAVGADDGCLYILRYQMSVQDGEWELVSFREPEWRHWGSVNMSPWDVLVVSLPHCDGRCQRGIRIATTA